MSGCGQNMVQLARGSKITPADLTGITVSTTSSYRESRGHNALILFFNLTAGTGTWTIKIQSRVPETNTFVDHYDNNGNLLAISSATASQSKFMVGIPDDFKIVATEDVDGGTVTIAYELLTV